MHLPNPAASGAGRLSNPQPVSTQDLCAERRTTGTRVLGKAEGGTGGRTLLWAANPRIKSKAVTTLQDCQRSGQCAMGGDGEKAFVIQKCRSKDACYDECKPSSQKQKRDAVAEATAPSALSPWPASTLTSPPQLFPAPPQPRPLPRAASLGHLQESSPHLRSGCKVLPS